jgi:site-specific DNA-methyltransferase (cytosine-N4-specific)
MLRSLIKKDKIPYLIPRKGLTNRPTAVIIRESLLGENMYWPNDFLDKIICGDYFDVMPRIPGNSIDICITSPPYWGMRDYENPAQIGSENTLEEYMGNLTTLFHGLFRILKPNGLLFFNIGDTYFSYWGNSKYKDTLSPSARAGYNENRRPKFKPDGWKKDKQKALIPFRAAIALQEVGFIVRNDIIWHKPNGKPETVKHRLNCSNEYWFFCCKDARTKSFHKTEILKKDLWTYPISKLKGHTATFPLKLIEDILKQCDGNIVFDPFMGSGTVALAAKNLNRRFIGIELSEKYCEIAQKRLTGG